MIKRIHEVVLAFDIETIPDRTSAILLGKLPTDVTETEAFRFLWEKELERKGLNKGEPTDKGKSDTQPFLPHHLVRIVSLCGVERRVVAGEVVLRLVRIPEEAEDPEQRNESMILRKFIELISANSPPQLVGYNSRGYEFPVFLRRALACKLRLPSLLSRPASRSGEVDYFDAYNDWHIDLMAELAPFGVKAPSLNDIATVCGIPGKLGTSGSDVASYWLESRYKEIVDYNEYDALTTYALWLRFVFAQGLLTRTQLRDEEKLFESLITQEIDRGKKHLEAYMTSWREQAEIIPLCST